MDDRLLVELGFNDNDAKAYRFLLVRGSLRPTQLQKLSGESRANCYAILDRLVDAGLAIKADDNKKLVYHAQSPQVLEDVIARQIAESHARLKKVQARMPQMMSVFNDRKDAPVVKHFTGVKELAEMYEDQMQQNDKDLYFVRSIADIAFFGIVKMKEIRHLAPKYHKKRYGITPLFHAPAGPDGDRRTNLTRTWIPQDDYRNPVEWAVSGNLVQAIVMKGDGYGVSIENQEIADSFRKILQLLSKYTKKDPEYEAHPWFKHDTKKPSSTARSIIRNAEGKGSQLEQFVLMPIPSIKNKVYLKNKDNTYRTHLLTLDARNDEPMVNIADYGIQGSSYYSRPNRLTGEPLAVVQPDVYVRRNIAEKLQKVDEFLRSDPSISKKYGQPLQLHVDEGFRDVRVQNYVYDVAFPAYFKKHKPGATDKDMQEARARTVARGTENGEVVNPHSPPPHYTGAAVDLNIQKADGTKLVFGLTAIVSLGKQAFTDYYEQLKESHAVEDDIEARQNRRLLYWLMKEQGFENNPEEWWHYSIGDQMWARTGGHAEAYLGIPPNIPEFNVDK